MSEGAGLPVSVIVPTIGRVDPLRRCLASLAVTSPAPDEILVVDQSHDPVVADLVTAFSGVGARLVPCAGLGVSAGRNVGLATARNDIVCITDDDCSVPTGWIGIAAGLAAQYPRAIVTGRVLPVGDPRGVPETKEDTEPCDYTGAVRGGLLFPNNVVLPRKAVLDAGAFDERFGPDEAAEDNEFCYRWLKQGRAMRFEPALMVWHHDWRTPDELERLYVRYARGEGFFYAKHLRQGDLRPLLWIARSLYWAARSYAAALIRRRPGWTDYRRGIVRGLPGGLAHGWRVFGTAPVAPGSSGPDHRGNARAADVE